MNRSVAFTGLLLVLGTCWAGCLRLPKAEPITNATSLIAYLQDRGIVLQALGPASQSFFIQTGQEYAVTGGGTLQIYEYESEGAAVLAASPVDLDQADASTRPHFYRSGSLVAAYFGEDASVDQALASVMVPQTSR